MSRLVHILPIATAMVVAALPVKAQDAFEELQRQVQEQLREQGRDPNLDLDGAQNPDQRVPPDDGQPDSFDQDPDSGEGLDADPGAGAGDDQGQSNALPQTATGQRVKNPVAVFSGLDKITGKITSFDVYIDETVQFGALQVTPRVCYTSVKGEAAKTDAFVQVDEITLARDIRQIFSGWMFADSPGLNAVEHPVYDVWLKSCKTESDVPAPTG